MSSGGPALAEETLAFLRESFQLFSVYLEESGDLFYDVDTSSSEEGLASSDEDEDDDDDDEWNSSEEEGLEYFLQNMSLLNHVVGMPPPRRRRKRNVPCKFYLMGNCRNGNQCDFQHNVAVPASAADASSPSSSSPQRAGPHPQPRRGGATTTSARQHQINVPCKFFANGQCRNGENCRFSHAAVGSSSAVSSSSTDKEDNLRECAICYEIVETFGLLENCDHCFCLPCIRTWRSSAKPEEDEHPFFSDTPSASTVRVCPMCRQTSYLVVPSKVWPRDAAHKANIEQVYRERLGAIPCKYFSNVQFCPFGEHCLYQHLEVKD